MMYRRFGHCLNCLLFSAFALTMITLNSCVATKSIVYFNDLPDTITSQKPVSIQTVKYQDPVILSNDILAITMQTIDQNETNTPITSSQVAMFNPLNGFLVDKNGNIELSLIGFVHVGGLTTSEAREIIKEKAKEYYKNPVVNVRIANFEVDIIGEIGHPGTYPFVSEKVDIFEALAAAGDLNITGKRTNVLLVRTDGQEKKMIRLDLTSSDVFRSPYFYLRQRDLLYVEPTRYKIETSDNRVSRDIGILSGIISLVTLFLAFKTFK